MPKRRGIDYNGGCELLSLNSRSLGPADSHHFQTESMVVTESERLTLRHALPDDVVAMRTVFGDAEVMRYGDGPKSDRWVVSWITQMNHSYREHGYGLWVVTFKPSGLPIGYCGLTWFPSINGQPEVEVGYRFARNHWGFGYATESAIAVRDYSYIDLGLNRLIAIIDPENRRSIRVAEKLGMQYEGDVMLPGYSHADSVYACHR
ncbi:GNAT family N-acetyltransferase [Roseiconus lacunae]|uniref:GNAT family N-acetyltransferase n=1 Tax=Roseiconus lacunae TaxID=2605694 RepID=UPI0030858D91|nr:GNAT family N-acetyltransferase [Stieleria sp. HD01]